MTAGVRARLERVRRGPQAAILASYAVGQGLVLVTGLARIPIIVHAIGSVGYGLLLAITSVAPWLLMVVNGLTSVARVDIAEALGAGRPGGALSALEHLLGRARRMAWALAAVSLAAAAVPWGRVLGGGQQVHLGSAELPLSVAISGLLVASCASGAVYTGLLQADRRVVVTSILPGVAAVVSLLVTAAAAVISAPFLVYVVAAGIASSAPLWIAHLLGARQRSALRGQAAAQPDGADQPYRSGTVADLAVMTGAAAPPLFSTGWDPLTLGAATGPVDVAAYGLASRLALLVTVGPSALYPHYWSEYARLRAAGDPRALLRRLRSDTARVTAMTAVLGAVFVLVGPMFGTYLGHGRVARPIGLYAAMAVLGVLSALQTVLLPVLGDRHSARRIAAVVFASMLPNVALSFVLSRPLGPAGPVVSSILFSILLLAVAVHLIRRNLGSGADTAASERGAQRLSSSGVVD